MSAEDGFARTSPGLMPCVEGPLPCPDPTPGVVDAATGRVAFEAIRGAAQLALRGGCEALVTAPISKAALHVAGLPYPGHTELLAELCGVRDFAMMLYLPQRLAPRTRAGLGVVHVTLHASVRQAIDAITTDAVVQKCHLAHEAARAYGVAAPRVGVAALNPHAGEGGLFGDEEARVIAPAVSQARAAGIDATGPHPADTLMHRAAAGEFDVVVAMLHDQGHIALKLLGMHGAVNVTLGLPIVRTSVAHGTAADLAWKGVAETSGMLAAIESAASLSLLKSRQDATSAKGRQDARNQPQTNADQRG
jgi:4-hydroxythreonine-4-phosphate dehydrogenase